MEALLADNFSAVLDDVARLTKLPDGVKIGTQRPGDKHYATLDAVRQDYPDYSQANQAREVLARMAETDVRPYFMERVTAYIRRFLRSLGIRAPLSVAEIKPMIVDSAKPLLRSSGNTSVNGCRSEASHL